MHTETDNYLGIQNCIQLYLIMNFYGIVEYLRLWGLLAPLNFSNFSELLQIC